MRFHNILKKKENSEILWAQNVDSFQFQAKIVDAFQQKNCPDSRKITDVETFQWLGRGYVESFQLLKIITHRYYFSYPIE